MDWKEVIRQLNTDDKNGLSEEEAKIRLEKFGPNELKSIDSISPWKMFLSQFRDALIIILIIAALISGAVAVIQGTTEEWFDAIVIMIIVFLNAVFGFVQEYKAEKTLQALKQMAAPRVRVIRDGKEKEIPARELVPGDIILLSAGDKISADGRLIEAVNLKVNEAPLTGESVPVSKRADDILDKDAYLGERINMVFAGCTVEYGRGKAVVTETGMSTALGKIAKMVQGEAEMTPLQRKLGVLGKQLGLAVLIIAAVVFGVGLTQGVDILEMFLTAVSLAVAAIPEGLPAVVTISLALGVQRMVKRNALVRRLPAVESLGSATVICTDKTGTLTKGEMNVREIFTGRTIYISGEGYEPQGEFNSDGRKIDPLQHRQLRWLLTASVLCNDAKLVIEDGRWKVAGDPTEGALLVTARKAGLDEESLREGASRIFEVPFDSAKKRMITVNEIEGKLYLFAKGAVESIIPLCDHICIDGEIRPLTEAERNLIVEKNGEMAGRALRVLAIAMREVMEEEELSEESLERGLILLGLVGMIDSPRKEAIEAIKVCKRAGIKVKMITGDHALTAKAIAHEMGIDDRENIPVLTGSDLERLNVEELSEIVKDVNVFARVSPEHKMKIVEALKRNGEIVAMTGDGVNDAPALKRADIGVAMGITGTDVSKEASEIVLLDDNFASIVHATEEGRGIYNNIRKFVSFLLTCNAGEVATMFLATLIFVDPEMLPFLLPIQILWINLVTDGLPALALGVEPTDPDVMKKPPRDPAESPITRSMIYRILTFGTVMAVGTLLAFYLEYSATANVTRARTVAFCTLVMFQLFYVFSVRSEYRNIWEVGIKSNIKLLYAVIVSFLLQLAVVYLPAMNTVFRTEPLGVEEWLISLPISLSALVISEIWKTVKKNTSTPDN